MKEKERLAGWRESCFTGEGGKGRIPPCRIEGPVIQKLNIAHQEWEENKWVYFIMAFQLTFIEDQQFQTRTGCHITRRGAVCSRLAGGVPTSDGWLSKDLRVGQCFVLKTF